jgi:hypothetical protein
MSGVEMLQRLTVSDVARWLEVHPFDIVRILVATGGTPHDLRFETEDVDRIRKMGGLEVWWQEGEPTLVPDREQECMLRAMASRMLEKEIGGPRTTRLDNIFRGLESKRQQLARELVQILLQHGWLATVSTETGTHVTITPGRMGQMANIAQGGNLPEDLAAALARA